MVLEIWLNMNFQMKPEITILIMVGKKIAARIRVFILNFVMRAMAKSMANTFTKKTLMAAI